MRAPFVNNTDPMPSDWADIAFNYLKDGHYGKLASDTRSIRPRQSASARDLGFLNYFCSRVLFSEGEHEQSFRKLHRAADIFNDVKEKVWNVIAVHRLANDYSKVGDTKNSRKYFELSLSLALDDEELSFLFSEIQGDYGCMLFSHGIDSRRALDFTEQALGKSQQVGNESTAFKLAVNCASMAESMMMAAQAFRYSRTALEISEGSEREDGRYFLYRIVARPNSVNYELDDVTQAYASLLANYGITLHSLGEINSALEYYERSHDIAARINDLEVLAVASNQIGQLLIEQNDHVGARNAIGKALKIIEKSEQEGCTVVLLHTNLAETLYYLGEIHEAERHFEIAKSMSTKLHLRREYIKTQVLHCALRIENKSQLNIRGELLQALEESAALSMQDTFTTCLRLLGALAIEECPELASEYLDKALITAEETHNMQELIKIHKTLTGHFKRNGNINSALYHSEQVCKYKDEVYTEEVKAKMTRMAILREVEAYQEELRLRDNQARELQSELQLRTNELSNILLKISEKKDFINSIEKVLQSIKHVDDCEKSEVINELLESIREWKSSSLKPSEVKTLYYDINDLYIRRILDVAPSISRAEMKVCVLLIMAMDSKQIAETLKLSIRSVENHRRMIRQKLGLAQGDSLSVFLMQKILINQ